MRCEWRVVYMLKKTPVLILGATGMLGHKLMQTLSQDYLVTGTVRRNASALKQNPLFSSMNLVGNVRAADINTISQIIEEINPHIIVNCIGIVKQLPEAQDYLQSIAINALFPHQLARICQNKRIRLIHVSTDCVFSGRKGQYTEEDPSDAEDIYGKTKYLGEVSYPGCLTIRTSIIGREIESSHGLIEWFFSQEGKTVSGYKKAIFSGLTTRALSEIIARIISECPDLHGVRQIASDPINKYDLLNLIKKRFNLQIVMNADETVVNDRSLNPGKFIRETKIQIPSWDAMIEQMYQDTTPYDDIRRRNVQQ
jgi:dTDP-4-dehydrorhamnose reductase